MYRNKFKYSQRNKASVYIYIIVPMKDAAQRTIVQVSGYNGIWQFEPLKPNIKYTHEANW